MENHKLSIIIPCYNCVSTLEEALTSVYEQNLAIPFEVVMVDDASTDTTKELMNSLALKYPNVKCFYHSNNRGGGATRNTAIEHTSHDLIFCLDSDDILPPNTLPLLLKTMSDKKCDGVVFEESKFFYKKNIKRTTSSKNVHDENHSIVLQDTFTQGKGFFTQVNFLYTKQSYYEAGKYPEHHGFDTQSFGIKYLATGHSVYLSPNTYYLHRRASENQSYFERVYESGEYSKNLYLIYEEIFFLFSPATRKEIINFDIFKNSSLKTRNLNETLIKLFKDKTDDFFIKDLDIYTNPNGFEKYVGNHANSKELTDVLCAGIYYYKNKKLNESLDCYKKIITNGIHSPTIYYNILRIMNAMIPNKNKATVEKDVSCLINSMQTVNQKIDLNPNIIKRIAIKIKNFLLK